MCTQIRQIYMTSLIILLNCLKHISFQSLYPTMYLYITYMCDFCYLAKDRYSYISDFWHCLKNWGFYLLCMFIDNIRSFMIFELKVWWQCWQALRAYPQLSGEIIINTKLTYFPCMQLKFIVVQPIINNDWQLI